MSVKKSALFICLGNICRSPIAEAVFMELIKSKGISDEWEVDSAAVGSWHVGKGPDKRAIKTLKVHNIQYSHVVRQISSEDFGKFDFIFGMDEENMEDLNSHPATKREPKPKAKLLMLGDFDPEGDRIIKDPYYDHKNDDGFEKCYQQCVRSCTAFLEKQEE